MRFNSAFKGLNYGTETAKLTADTGDPVTAKRVNLTDGYMKVNFFLWLCVTNAGLGLLIH